MMSRFFVAAELQELANSEFADSIPAPEGTP
jgi:hypothetical protein